MLSKVYMTSTVSNYCETFAHICESSTGTDNSVLDRWSGCYTSENSFDNLDEVTLGNSCSRREGEAHISFKSPKKNSGVVFLVQSERQTRQIPPICIYLLEDFIY